jgi:hypothetical protein
MLIAVFGWGIFSIHIADANGAVRFQRMRDVHELDIENEGNDLLLIFLKKMISEHYVSCHGRDLAYLISVRISPKQG